MFLVPTQLGVLNSMRGPQGYAIKATRKDTKRIGRSYSLLIALSLPLTSLRELILLKYTILKREKLTAIFVMRTVVQNSLGYAYQRLRRATRSIASYRGMYLHDEVTAQVIRAFATVQD